MGLRVFNRYEFTLVFWHKMEFKDWQRITADDHPLWIPEQDLQEPCQYFVCVLAPVRDRDYWLWCTNMLQGYVRCFSSSENEEWWGFTNEADITMWSLKWL